MLYVKYKFYMFLYVITTIISLKLSFYVSGGNGEKYRCIKLKNNYFILPIFLKHNIFKLINENRPLKSGRFIFLVVQTPIKVMNETIMINNEERAVLVLINNNFIQK
jgi:hypothetical protein